MIKRYNALYEKWLSDGSSEGMITIFTPTYNRANLIVRAYDCLLQQTNKNFIWLVVNDGSNDNTDEALTELMNKNELPILYISKANGGKHSAFETAFSEVVTEYFMCLDDDDIYYPDAVDTFLREWNSIKLEGKMNIIGAIRVLTQEANGEIVCGSKFDEKLLGAKLDQTTLESNYVKHEFYENWTCYNMSALKTIDLFPKNYWLCVRHKFFSEAIWQGRFARKFKCRYYFKVLREYRHDTEHSIIRSNKSYQHYLDMFINTKMILDQDYDYAKKYLKGFVQSILIISILRAKLDISLSDLLQNTNRRSLKLLYILLSPIAYISPYPKIKK